MAFYELMHLHFTEFRLITRHIVHRERVRPKSCECDAFRPSVQREMRDSRSVFVNLSSNASSNLHELKTEVVDQ